MHFVLAFWLIAPVTAFAMPSATFKELMAQLHSEKYTEVEKYLGAQRETLKEDPEYFVVLLNYVLSKGHRAGVVIAKGVPQEGEFSVQAADGKPMGFLGHREEYGAKLISDGIERTELALPHFRARLDIRLGAITAAERIKRWDMVSRQMIDMLKTSREINNKWIWGQVGSMDGNPKAFMIDNVLARTESLFHLETNPADKALIDTSEALIRYYPELPYGYANLGTLALTKRNYSQAEKYLKQAEKIAPQDELVQGSLAKLKEMRGK